MKGLILFLVVFFVVNFQCYSATKVPQEYIKDGKYILKGILSEQSSDLEYLVEVKNGKFINVKRKSDLWGCPYYLGSSSYKKARPLVKLPGYEYVRVASRTDSTYGPAVRYYFFIDKNNLYFYCTGNNRSNSNSVFKLIPIED